MNELIGARVGRIGIVVPCYNRVKKTRRFIRCLSDQHYRNFRLYLVDSGSRDGTAAILPFPNIDGELIEATPDHWWAAATNSGVRKALADGCEYILTINDDALFEPQFLGNLLGVLVRNSLDILAARIDVAQEPGRIWSLGSFCLWGSPYLFQLKFNGYWEDALPKHIQQKEVYPAQALCGDGVLFRRRVFEQVGLYEERWCPQVHADSELILRAAKHGFRAFVATQVVLYNDVCNAVEKHNDESGEVTWESSGRRRPARVRFRLLRKIGQRLRSIRRVFFDKKSDVYYRPVVFVVFRHCPRGYRVRTIFRYFVYKYITVLADGMVRRIKLDRGRFSRRGLMLVVRLGAKWLFDTRSYEPVITKEISEDGRWFERLDARKWRL